MSPDQSSGTPSRDRQVQDAWLEHRSHLERVASRMLGRTTDAEDVVQEAFGRLAAVKLDDIDDLRGWLTVVVRRLCIDRIRSAPVRRETSDPAPHERNPFTVAPIGEDPADRLTLDDQVRLALGHMLDQLTPAERTSFVLHDVFGFPYDAVADIVGRSAGACRQLASRARHTVRAGDSRSSRRTDESDLESLAQRFRSACEGGDLEALVGMLDPSVAGDAVSVDGRVLAQVRGPQRVARQALRFLGQRSGMWLVPLQLERSAGILAMRDDQVVAVVRLDVRDGVVTHLRGIVR